MLRYRVVFWYHTDARTDWEGEAADEVSAIGIAKTALKLTDPWCYHPGFRISVEAL